MMSNKSYKKFVIWGVVVLVAVFLAVVVVNCVVKRNRLLMIENIEDYYYDLPKNVHEEIFASLNKAVSYNTDDVPLDGAYIRSTEPFAYEYNQDYSGFIGQFIVDIPSIQQSYNVRFDFNKDAESGLDRTAAIVSCLSEDLMIYPDFDCKDYNDLFKAGDWR